MRSVMVLVMIILYLPLVLAAEPAPPDMVTVWGSISNESSLDCFLLDDAIILGEEDVTYSSMIARHEGLCFYRIDVLRKEMPDMFRVVVGEQESSKITFSGDTLQREDIELNFSDDYHLDDEPEEIVDDEEDDYEEEEAQPTEEEEAVGDYEDGVEDDHEDEEAEPTEEDSDESDEDAGEDESDEVSGSSVSRRETVPSREPRTTRNDYDSDEEPEEEEEEVSSEEENEEEVPAQEDDVVEERSSDIDELMELYEQKQEEEVEQDVSAGPMARAYDSIRDSLTSSEPMFSDTALLLFANVVVFLVISILLVFLFSKRKRRKRVRIRR